MPGGGFYVAIPARAASSRLPGKALADLGGKPMLQWVYEKACAAGARAVIIATDDEAIAAAARRFGATARLTSTTHVSGTDRIGELAAMEGWADEEIVVNVQGDEPLIPPLNIVQVAQLLATHPQAALATLSTPVTSQQEFLDPNAVKVVTDGGGRALYFSRAPIPVQRDGVAGGFAGARRHVGLYAYRVAALRRLTALAPSPLERAEKLEQLRALEHGLIIQVAEACAPPGPDVNTAEDLRRVAALIG
jgi:3-deoxy-manno-octulosonate cytidylyltransferase (CMP-KDO synthetase)